MPIVIAGFGTFAGVALMAALVAGGLPLWVSVVLFPLAAALGSLLLAVGVYFCRLRHERGGRTKGQLQV